MGKLHSGVVSWWDSILDWGAFAVGAFHDFGTALWVFVVVLYALMIKCISLVLQVTATIGEVFAEKSADIHASIQRVTADFTEVCLNCWDDLLESFEVTVGAMGSMCTGMIAYTLSSLTALGHSVLRSVEELFSSGLARFAALWEFAGTRIIPRLVELWSYIARHLELHERWDWMRATAVPRIQQGLQGVDRLLSGAQPLLERLAEASHKVLFSMYCAFVLIVWFILVMNENEGMVTGFLFGLTNGFGMVSFWAWMMAMREKQRAKSISEANVLDGSAQEQLKELFGRDDKPAGALFEGFEKVEWLNKLLTKVWPSLAAVIENHRPQLREFLEAFMENYRLGVFQVIGENEAERKMERYIPAGEPLTALYLNDLDLGTAAPQIGGVKLRGTKDNKMVMDVRLRWDTEALTVTLGIGTSDGILKVLLENLKITATVRVHVYFVEEPPFVSILVLFSPSKLKPVIHYRLTPYEDALEHLQPVVMRKLREFICNSINDSLHWPNRLVVVPTWAAKPTVNPDDLQLKPHGQLDATIVKGENLVNLYAYVLLYIRVKFKVRTRSVENTPNPVWNEEFYLDADDQASQTLVLQVMNEPKGKDELIGVVTYPLTKLEPDKDFELELPVQTVDPDSEGKDGGSLMIVLRYHVYTPEEQEAAVAAEKKLDEALAAPEAPGSYSTAADLLHG